MGTLAQKVGDIVAALTKWVVRSCGYSLTRLVRPVHLDHLIHGLPNRALSTYVSAATDTKPDCQKANSRD